MAKDLAHYTTNGEVWVRSLTLFLYPGVEMAAGKVSGNLENTWRLRTMKWVPNSCRLLGATESVKNMACEHIFALLYPCK